MNAMKWFRVKKPKSIEAQFVGKLMGCYSTFQDAHDRKNGQLIRVEHICGNLQHPAMFQINGAYFISMLDAYCLLNKERLPPLDEHQAFVSIICEKVERAPKSVEDEIHEFSAEDLSDE